MLPPHEEFEIAVCLQHSSALQQLNPIETCTIRSRDPMHQTFESGCLKQKLLQSFILKDEKNRTGSFNQCPTVLISSFHASASDAV